MGWFVGLPTFRARDVGHLRNEQAPVTIAAMNFVSRVWLGGLERGMAGLDRVSRRSGLEPAHLRTGGSMYGNCRWTYHRKCGST
jgi:hypothetical protein